MIMIICLHTCTRMYLCWFVVSLFSFRVDFFCFFLFFCCCFIFFNTNGLLNTFGTWLSFVFRFFFCFCLFLVCFISTTSRRRTRSNNNNNNLKTIMQKSLCLSLFYMGVASFANKLLYAASVFKFRFFFIKPLNIRFILKAGCVKSFWQVIEHQ